MIRAWNRFFFTPVDPLPIALFRIVFGALVLVTLAALWPDLPTWFGESGVLPRASPWLSTYGDRLDVTRWLPDGDAPMRGFVAMLAGAALLLSRGLCTRLSAAVVFIGVTSLHHRDPLILHSGDTLMRVCAFFLMWSQAGRALSLDRVIRRMRGREGAAPVLAAPWGQRLLQIQVSVMYISSVGWKLTGAMWRNGTATWVTSQIVDFQRHQVPYVFEHLWTVRLITWSTLAAEAALGTLIWIPRLRYYVLASGVLLHLGIDYTMDLPMFQWMTLSTYLCFLPPQDLRAAGKRLVAWIAGPAASAPAEVVVQDGRG